MRVPPAFASLQEYRARRADRDFWWPHVLEILQRHGLLDTHQAPVAGFNPTYPTFLYGDVVLKLFGYVQAWPRGHRFERAALALVTTNPEIAAPTLLAAGQLDADRPDSWPYLISRRLPGIAAEHVTLSQDQQRTLAADLGRQVRLIHALPHEAGDWRAATHEEWASVDLADAAARSSLPAHLVAQAVDYVAQLGPQDRVLTHGDIVAMHVFVQDGRFAGIIDWGDATVTDRHVELIQLYRDTFRCDKALFQVFLEAADWPRGPDFPLQALGYALVRQTLGLAQHPSPGKHASIDVFMPIAEKYALRDIATLDELATLLFA